MNTPADIAHRLVEDSNSGALDEFCTATGIDVVVLHGSAVEDPDTAGDVDVAYSVNFDLPEAQQPNILDVAAAFLTRYGDGIDIMDLNSAGIVARHLALSRGTLLADLTGHKYGDLQMAAAREYINTEYRRKLERESLLG